MRRLTAGLLALTAALPLAACKQEPGPRSLVGDYEAPGTYALAEDTITIWRRTPLPGGAWRFQSYAISPGGDVYPHEEFELPDAVVAGEAEIPLPTETQAPAASFMIDSVEMARIRSAMALLRSASLGPDDRVSGYAGEETALGCILSAGQPRVVGVNFLNTLSWGAFALQANCRGREGTAARISLDELLSRLDQKANEHRASTIPAATASPAKRL